MLPDAPLAAPDATGLESQHASRYSYLRVDKEMRCSGWPMPTTVTDCHTHLLLAAVVTRGPGHDADQFRQAVRAATTRVPLDTLLGDAAFDGENLHAHARDELGVRSTVFKIFSWPVSPPTGIPLVTPTVLRTPGHPTGVRAMQTDQLTTMATGRGLWTRFWEALRRSLRSMTV